MKNPFELFRIFTISRPQLFYFSRSKIKSFAPEPYLEIQKSSEAPEKQKESALPQIEITIKKYNKLEQEKQDSARAESKPIPCSPILYPIKVFFLISIFFFNGILQLKLNIRFQTLKSEKNIDGAPAE